MGPKRVCFSSNFSVILSFGGRFINDEIRIVGFSLDVFCSRETAAREGAGRERELVCNWTFVEGGDRKVR